MTKLIEPRVLKGFRDYLPETMIPREQLMETARRVYRSYGFSPIDTPAMEYAETLVGKGGEESDKQVYRFVDHGDRDVALRFDLTVPLARFAAQHFHVLGTPFKRYHIAPVWRGENTQRGRYREFVQCDFDTIGSESNLADIETLLVIHDLMQAIGFSKFQIRVNHRGVLNGVLASFGLQDQATAVLRAIDKLGKIGIDGVRQELVDKVGLMGDSADQVLKVARPDATLDDAAAVVGSNPTGQAGVARLRELFGAVQAAGVPAERVRLDVSIARGLDYYTGTIFETFLDDLPGIGSVCSGGRYDNLAGMFTKEKLPGVGASLGLDRLLAAMEELKLLKSAATPAQVLMTIFDEHYLGRYLQAAAAVRAGGIAVETFADTRAIGKQLKYADKRGFRFALIAGGDDFAQGVWQLKELATGAQASIPADQLVEQLRSRLAETGTSARL